MRSTQMPLPERKFVITHVVENVPNFKENEEYKKAEEHFNIPWQLKFRRQNGNLVIFLYCLKPVETEKWSIQTELNFKLMSITGNSSSTNTKCCFGNSKEDLERKSERSDENESVCFGWNNFIAWDKLEKHYMKDKKVILEVQVTIKQITGFGKEHLRNFDISIKDVSDVVLVANDKKFYLSKLFLSLQSTYFKTLFFGNFEESKQSEVVLKGINSDDFQYFLELIHGESSIDDNNIDGILHLADMYDSPTALRRCEEFLLKESKWTMEEKLELSDRYHLASLKEKCRSEIENAAACSVLSDKSNESDSSEPSNKNPNQIEENSARDEPVRPARKFSFFSCIRK